MAIVDDIDIMTKEALIKEEGFTEAEAEALIAAAKEPIGPGTLFLTFGKNILAHTRQTCVKEDVIPGTGPIFLCAACNPVN